MTENGCLTPVRNRSNQLDILIFAFGPVAAMFIGVRVLHKQFLSAHNRLKWEDWTMLLIIPLGVVTIVITKVGLTAHGMGRDIWGVKQSDLMDFVRFFYIAQMLYILLIGLIKLTLCFFYLSIFAGTKLQRLLWATVAFHIAFSVAFVVATALQCTPVQYQWERFRTYGGPITKGHCININVGTWCHAVISVASDIWLLAIPLSQVKGLRLHWKKKVGAALMFATGAW